MSSFYMGILSTILISVLVGLRNVSSTHVIVASRNRGTAVSS
jgi:hypothetical protein